MTVELLTKEHYRLIAIRSIALVQYTIDKYEIEDLDGFTCPHYRALAKQLAKIGQITWCWK